MIVVETCEYTKSNYDGIRACSKCDKYLTDFLVHEYDYCPGCGRKISDESKENACGQSHVTGAAPTAR